MVKALPRPEGFSTVTPHLVVKNCAQALEWYRDHLGAQIVYNQLGPGGKVLHATMLIGDAKIMLNDDFPEWGSGKETHPQALGGSPVTLHLYVDDADAIYNSAIEGGATSTMPVADQFWGDRYGTFTDPFGHAWAVATHIADPTPEEIAAAMAAMSAG